MKKLLTLLLLICTLSLFGQDNKDIEDLVKLGEIYSKNVNATGANFVKEVQKLRKPGLNHMIDALIAVGKGDVKLLSKEFLSKPPAIELKYWYVLREIHYNNQNQTDQSRTNIEIALETLEKDIDSRWLLDNYYYRIRGGISKMFNEKNLNKYDIDLNNYGLENDTEKAILYFNLTSALTQRFVVLHMLKNYDKLLVFAGKLPTINEKPYYTLTSFNFEDFDWIGYDKTESYKEKHIGGLYAALISQLAAYNDKDKSEDMRTLYFNSILYLPDYFKYAGELKADLKYMYDKLNE